MKRGFKLIIIIMASLLVCYVGYFIFDAVTYSYKIEWRNVPDKYLWLFKDSIRINIDSTSRFSYVRKENIYNHYIYNDRYDITIWEFRDLRSIRLEDIIINHDLAIENAKINSGETLNVGSSPEITLKYGFDFHNSINVSLDNDSKIDSSFATNDYKGFYGTVNEMLLSNDEGRPCVLFNYSNGKQYGLFIWYKSHGSFYLLIINSNNPFDPQKLIKIFNLS